MRVCPYCQNDAPVVYRGMLAYCTACGAMRPPVMPTKSVNLAGQPSQVGGVVAKVFGWLVLVFGVSLAGILTAIFQAIWPEGVVGYALGIPTFLITLMVGVGLLMGGKSLSKSGKDTEEAVREKAIWGMAQTRGGILTKDEVARVLSVSPQEGDAYLTRLAKTKPDEIAVDVDDEGNVLFRFRQIAARPRDGVRVDVARTRVEVPVSPVPETFAVPGMNTAAANTYPTEAEILAQAEAEAEEAAQQTSRRAR